MATKYDMDALMSSGEFEQAALDNFESRQAYFDKLGEFFNNWKGYLRSYNPTVVIYSPDTQSEFLADVGIIADSSKALGMPRVTSELENLSEACGKANEKILSDGLIKFFAALEIISGIVESALRADGDADTEVSAKAVADEKPIIFAVDDRPELLAVIVDILSKNYKVISMTDGNIAIKATEIYTPDLFLLDIEMPEMSGFELAEKIRSDKRFKKTPIFFLTGVAKKEYVLNSKSYGASEYLLKPVDKDILLRKIKKHLA